MEKKHEKYLKNMFFSVFFSQGYFSKHMFHNFFLEKKMSIF